MATRKKKKRKHFDKSILERGGVAALKASGSAALGVTVAAVEVEMGETAGSAVRAGMAVAGIAGAILIDPEESPGKAEAASKLLDATSTMTAHKMATDKLTSWKTSREAKANDAMVAQLKADMLDSIKADEDVTKKNGKIEKPKGAEVPKAKAKKTTQAATETP